MIDVDGTRQAARHCIQEHTHQLLGTFAGPGNGDYRGELRRAMGVITSYATQLELSPVSILVRLDGLYGDAAPLLDVLSAGLSVITRSRAYHLLDLERVKQTLARPPDHVNTPPREGHDTIPLRLCIRSFNASRTRGTPSSCNPSRHLFFSRCRCRAGRDRL